MAKRSTRNLILASKDRLDRHLEAAESELQRMSELADGRSDIISYGVVPALGGIAQLRELLADLFKGL